MIANIPFNPAEIDAILFDLDGTLIDTDDADVAKWTRRLARYRGGEPKTDARKFVMAIETPVNAMFTVLDFVGLDVPMMRLMIRLNGGDDPSKLPPVHGAPEVVKTLSGKYELAVVSTRTLAEGNAFLEVNGIREHISASSGRDNVWRIKPHPQPVLHAAQTLGVSPGRCLMVGDTTVDIRSGLRGGAWTCGVLSGYGERAELERIGAHVIIDSIADLPALLGM